MHVISVCQPTVPVLAAVSLMASHGETTPLTMTMMGGPIDARKSPTAVNNLATNKSHNWFENNVIYRVPQNFPGAGRRVYPGFLQHTGFVAMNPDRHLSSHYDYFLDLVRGDEESAESHREFYDEYNAVLDMPAEYYLDTIKKVFQEFALVNGTWVVEGEPVRPQDITRTALLTIEGELDDISGAGQTKAAHELCTGIPKPHHFHYDADGAGHYGIFSGRRWREMVYPRVRDFIASYDKTPAASRPSHRACQGGRRPATRATPARAARKAAPRAEHGHAVSPAADAWRHRRARRGTARALPQTQCTRCGYPDCRAYARGHGAGRGRHQPLPAGRCRRHRPAGAPDRARRQAARRRTRRRRPAHAWRSSTKPGASAARCASRPARWIASSAHPSRCTPSSTSCAPAASCACRCARWTASRWSR